MCTSANTSFSIKTSDFNMALKLFGDYKIPRIFYRKTDLKIKGLDIIKNFNHYKHILYRQWNHEHDVFFYPASKEHNFYFANTRQKQLMDYFCGRKKKRRRTGISEILKCINKNTSENTVSFSMSEQLPFCAWIHLS